MALSITGKVIEVGKPQQVTEKLKKRTLIVEYAENVQYPEQIQFEAVNDKCNLLDELREGDEVTVHFNLRGRSYVGKDGKKGHFNSLGLWKCDILKTTGAPSNGYIPSASENDPESPF